MHDQARPPWWWWWYPPGLPARCLPRSPAGANFVPFTPAHQRVLVQAFRDIVLPKQGPVQLTSYREG